MFIFLEACCKSGKAYKHQSKEQGCVQIHNDAGDQHLYRHHFHFKELNCTFAKQWPKPKLSERHCKGQKACSGALSLGTLGSTLAPDFHTPGSLSELYSLSATHSAKPSIHTNELVRPVPRVVGRRLSPEPPRFTLETGALADLPT